MSMTHENMKIIKDFGELLCKQIEKINKKGDITPDELTRMDNGYSRDEANHKMRTDLEMKLASASNEEERKAIMKCLRALDN